MEITALKLSKTNCFLIKNHNKYVLVDTGYEFEWALFSKRLREAGVDLSEISHLILTHHHDDHCGLLNKIVERNPDIRIIMSNLAEGPLKNGQNYHTPGSGHVNRRIHFILSLKQKVDKKWTHTFPPYLIRKNDILITKETTLKEIEIDLNGKIIVPCEYDSISGKYYTGLILVKKNNKYGFFDTTGIEAVPCIYDEFIWNSINNDFFI